MDGIARERTRLPSLDLEQNDVVSGQVDDGRLERDRQPGRGIRPLKDRGAIERPVGAARIDHARVERQARQFHAFAALRRLPARGDDHGPALRRLEVRDPRRDQPLCVENRSAGTSLHGDTCQRRDPVATLDGVVAHLRTDKAERYEDRSRRDG